jgi:hypothetical protein
MNGCIYLTLFIRLGLHEQLVKAALLSPAVLLLDNIDALLPVLQRGTSNTYGRTEIQLMNTLMSLLRSGELPELTVLESFGSVNEYEAQARRAHDNCMCA